MPEFHCQRECSKVHHQLQASTQGFSRLISQVFHSLVDMSLCQVAPDNLKCFSSLAIVFGFVLSLW